ncbi:MAG TPA: hypothetical protein VJ672_12265 [Gemmatimonadaceae bacterium]|nr:hypothetical protein [Gemmatimonadaceae bacterium]
MTVATLFVRAEDYSAASSWHLLEWCRSRGADEFGLAFLGPPYLPETLWAKVDAILAPFRRRIASAGDRWALTGESIAALRELLAEGLFTYAPAIGALENPVVYRGGRVFLSVVSQEREGTLHLGPEDEQSLERTGLPAHKESRSA